MLMTETQYTDVQTLSTINICYVIHTPGLHSLGLRLEG